MQVPTTIDENIGLRRDGQPVLGTWTGPKVGQLARTFVMKLALVERLRNSDTNFAVSLSSLAHSILDLGLKLFRYHVFEFPSAVESLIDVDMTGYTQVSSWR